MLLVLVRRSRVCAHMGPAACYAASVRRTSIGSPARSRSLSQRHNVVRWTFSREAASSRDADAVMAARMIEESGRLVLRPMQRTVAKGATPVNTPRCDIRYVANRR